MSIHLEPSTVKPSSAAIVPVSNVTNPVILGLMKNIKLNNNDTTLITINVIGNFPMVDSF